MEILEIEIKAYCDSHKEIVEKIQKMGAVFVSSNEEVDLYFNHPVKNFEETDEALRIRQVRGSNVLTYKGPKIGEKAKSRIEKETEVDDFESMRRILNFLDFKETSIVKKVRDLYTLVDAEICLDKVQGLGDFIEFEKKGTDRVRIEKELFDLAKELGVDKFERKSYLELLLEKK